MLMVTNSQFGMEGGDGFGDYYLDPTSGEQVNWTGTPISWQPGETSRALLVHGVGRVTIQRTSSAPIHHDSASRAAAALAPSGAGSSLFVTPESSAPVHQDAGSNSGILGKMKALASNKPVLIGGGLVVALVLYMKMKR